MLRQAARLLIALAAAGCSSPPPPHPWQVSDHGAGPIRIGMSVAEAAAALGTPVTAAAEGCDYITPPGAPEGVRFMVAGTTVARVDVTAGDTPTAEGARIGQAEDEVTTLYTGRVATSPHKYEEGGHYLTVLPKEGQNPRLRLVFETNGKTVTRYRAGRLPEVESGRRVRMTRQP